MKVNYIEYYNNYLPGVTSQTNLLKQQYRYALIWCLSSLFFFFYKYTQLSFSRTYLFTGRVLIHMSLATLISLSLTSPHLPSQQIITAVSINLFNPTSFKVQNSTFLPPCIYMLCVYLRTNRKMCPTQHSVVGSYYQNGVYCVVRTGSLTLRRLMSYIYMEHPFLMFLDHTQRRSTVGRTPLDE